VRGDAKLQRACSVVTPRRRSSQRAGGAPPRPVASSPRRHADAEDCNARGTSTDEVDERHRAENGRGGRWRRRCRKLCPGGGESACCSGSGAVFHRHCARCWELAKLAKRLPWRRFPVSSRHAQKRQLGGGGKRRKLALRGMPAFAFVRGFSERHGGLMGRWRRP
jgi:hypothetical protein